MIGLIADSSEHGVVREFFELFKTPWEFFREGRHYPVVLCAGELGAARPDASLILLYSGRRLPQDAGLLVEAIPSRDGAATLAYEDFRIPVYGRCLRFQSQEASEGAAPVLPLPEAGGRRIIRLGYDLFGEVLTLITAGQPVQKAMVPALDLHISLLRHLIRAARIPLLEIPPAPQGYPFTVCLTHDVDHPSLRRHGFGHTLLGFLYRAVVGSLGTAVKGRRPLRDLWTNWSAVLGLPLVYLGIGKDPWCTFKRYMEIEEGLGSTWFVIPFRDRPGLLPAGGPAKTHGRRASSYGAKDIAGPLGTLQAQGREIGVHGIDAWADPAAGRREAEEVTAIAGTARPGVRMHWLYFDARSPAVLEEAGFDYDSTCGYNETVGFRCGTSQVFQFRGATSLLELPLLVMDTALFYAIHLNLSEEEAEGRVEALIEQVAGSGGCFTVNWHDRSIAPERLWDRFYLRLLHSLRARQPWFATCRQAVAWFRKRRSAIFEQVEWTGNEAHFSVSFRSDPDVPDLVIRVYPAGEPAFDVPATDRVFCFEGVMCNQLPA